MTYNTKSKILQIGKFEKVKLTHREHKLLICLSNSNIARYEDILRDLGISMNDLRRLKKRLLDDTGHQVEIKTLTGVGYKLISEIYFE